MSATFRVRISTHLLEHKNFRVPANWTIQATKNIGDGTAFVMIEDTDAPPYLDGHLIEPIMQGHKDGSVTVLAYCREAVYHGKPFRYCACGWTEEPEPEPEPTNVEALSEEINKALNDANHEHLCACKDWPKKCEHYTFGEWDSSVVDFTVGYLKEKGLL